MALVNMQSWLAERGFLGRPGAEAQGVEPAGLEGRLAELEKMIAYQADLIRRLQTALRSELSRRPPTPSLGGARPPPTGRVIRKRRPPGQVAAPTPSK
jgi:hypothetical protein